MKELLENGAFAIGEKGGTMTYESSNSEEEYPDEMSEDSPFQEDDIDSDAIYASTLAHLCKRELYDLDPSVYPDRRSAALINANWKPIWDKRLQSLRFPGEEVALQWSLSNFKWTDGNTQAYAQELKKFLRQTTAGRRVNLEYREVDPSAVLATVICEFAGLRSKGGITLSVQLNGVGKAPWINQSPDADEGKLFVFGMKNGSNHCSVESWKKEGIAYVGLKGMPDSVLAKPCGERRYRAYRSAYGFLNSCVGESYRGTAITDCMSMLDLFFKAIIDIDTEDVSEPNQKDEIGETSIDSFHGSDDFYTDHQDKGGQRWILDRLLKDDHERILDRLLQNRNLEEAVRKYFFLDEADFSAKSFSTAETLGNELIRLFHQRREKAGPIVVGPAASHPIGADKRLRDQPWLEPILSELNNRINPELPVLVCLRNIDVVLSKRLLELIERESETVCLKDFPSDVLLQFHTASSRFYMYDHAYRVAENETKPGAIEAMNVKFGVDQKTRERVGWENQGKLALSGFVILKLMTHYGRLWKYPVQRPNAIFTKLKDSYEKVCQQLVLQLLHEGDAE